MLAYRADIDGLRAVAVVLVLLFHAEFQAFSGGYIGVDVFFVISGFLITSLILKDLEGGKFSIIHFYERRIRRIFPALTVILLSTLVVSFLLFMPAEFKNFGRDLAGASGFASNIVFWRVSGYFDTSNWLKPLIHTWSLAVEEQYYIFFPVYMMLAYKYARRYIVPLTIAGLVVSFLINIWGISTGRFSAAFYLLPTRAWELLIGSLLAFRFIPELRSSLARNALALAGLGMILYSGTVFDSHTDFPGAAAMLPAIGAALLIFTGMGPGTYTARALGHRCPVFIGKISYSLYLWHWPLLVFAQYYLIRDLTTAERLLVLASSFALAALSWRFVEQPFRKKDGVFKRRNLFITGLSAMAVLLVTGLAIYKLDGLPQRFPEKVSKLAMASKGGDYPDAGLEGTFDTQKIIGDADSDKKPFFVLWGDSHATTMMPAAGMIAEKQNLKGYGFSKAGCMPAVDFREISNTHCIEVNEAITEVVRRENIKTVILVARWSAYPRWWSDMPDPGGTRETREKVREAILGTVRKLQKMGKEVVTVAEVPHIQGWQVPSVLARKKYFGRGPEMEIPIEKHLGQQDFVLGLFEEIKNITGVRVIYPHKKLCAKGICRVELNGRSLYFDDDHLSDAGSELVSPLFEGVFDNGGYKGQ
jgi:peptidoglycan/LPS O-acetylase OafA/YrhL